MYIDINKLLPPFLQELRELQVINDVNNKYFNDLLQEMVDLLMRLSIEECDEEGLKRWEKLIQCYPYEDDTVETRKKRLYRKIGIKDKYNMYNLKKTIREIQGNDNFEIRLKKVSPYIFKLEMKTTVETKWQFNDILDVLNDMLPCNVALQFNNAVKMELEDTELYRFAYGHEYESLTMEVNTNE